MPELPEVHTFQQYFNEAALNVPIHKVEVYDDKIIRNLSAAKFISKFKGRTFVDSIRRGKYLFAELDNGHHLLLHFGMTGDLKYYQDLEETPKHERFVFIFNDGFRLGFDCPRKFARIVYIENLEAYIKEVKLGVDALSIDESSFISAMENRKTSIKSFLLNQKNIAGLGNLYVDEILYQAKIHPASQLLALNKKHKKKIYSLMQSILEKAVSHTAHYKSYPDDWFFSWRVEGQQSPDGKSEVSIEKIAGRTTYFFEGYQKLYTEK